MKGTSVATEDPTSIPESNEEEEEAMVAAGDTSPAVLIKCLKLLTATMQDLKITSLNAMLHTLMETFVTGSVRSEVAGVRREAAISAVVDLLMRRGLASFITSPQAEELDNRFCLVHLLHLLHLFHLFHLQHIHHLRHLLRHLLHLPHIHLPQRQGLLRGARTRRTRGVTWTTSTRTRAPPSPSPSSTPRVPTAWWPSSQRLDRTSEYENF